jgi:hypothetical protein
LRVTIDGGRVFARIENPAGGCSTEGVAVEKGKWIHIAAVKTGTRLLLYLNGEVAGQASAHSDIRTESRFLGVGFNPLFPGGEFFRGQLDHFAFYARALSEEEIRAESDE